MEQKGCLITTAEFLSANIKYLYLIAVSGKMVAKNYLTQAFSENKVSGKWVNIIAPLSTPKK